MIEEKFAPTAKFDNGNQPFLLLSLVQEIDSLRVFISLDTNTHFLFPNSIRNSIYATKCIYSTKKIFFQLCVITIKIQSNIFNPFEILIVRLFIETAIYSTLNNREISVYPQRYIFYLHQHLPIRHWPVNYPDEVGNEWSPISLIGTWCSLGRG